jgi:hypothetical protein
MGRDTLAGHLVEIDEGRGTFTIHSTWARNLFGAIASLVFSAFFGIWGCAILACAWFGTPSIPVTQWQWHHSLMFGALTAFLTAIGLFCLCAAFGVVWKIALSAVRGFPPGVLDRCEGRCREGKHTLFRLDGLDSVHVAEEHGEDVSYVLRFRFREGKPRDWLESRSTTRASCESLGLAVAHFLDVPITGLEAAKKEPVLEL